MMTLAVLLVDRFDLALAFQVWQSMFMNALDKRVVSNNENDWVNSKESALEYLARGRLMDLVARFCDGVPSGVADQAARGLSLVREDVAALSAELDALLYTRKETLKANLLELGQSEDRRAIQRELARVPEMTQKHRHLFGAAALALEPADTEVAAAPAIQHYTKANVPKGQGHYSPGYVMPEHDASDPDAAAEAHASRFFRPGKPG